MARLIVLLLTLPILLLAGCNTVKGFGKDLEQGGQSLQREADEHR